MFSVYPFPRPVVFNDCPHGKQNASGCGRCHESYNFVLIDFTRYEREKQIKTKQDGKVERSPERNVRGDDHFHHFIHYI